MQVLKSLMYKLMFQSTLPIRQEYSKTKDFFSLREHYVNVEHIYLNAFLLAGSMLDVLTY